MYGQLELAVARCPWLILTRKGGEMKNRPTCETCQAFRSGSTDHRGVLHPHPKGIDGYFYCFFNPEPIPKDDRCWCFRHVPEEPKDPAILETVVSAEEMSKLEPGDLIGVSSDGKVHFIERCKPRES